MAEPSSVTRTMQKELHSKLLTFLGEQLVEEKFQQFKDIIETAGNIPPRDLEKTTTPARLFIRLERDDKIRVGDYTFLKEVFRGLREAQLIKRIEADERKIRNLGPIEAPVLSNGSLVIPEKGSSQTLIVGGKRKCIHEKLLEDLARDTTNDELESMKGIASDRLRSSGALVCADDVSTPKELLTLLDRWSEVGIGDYDLLKYIFKMTRNTARIRMIEEAQKQLMELDCEAPHLSEDAGQTTSASKNQRKQRGVEGDAKLAMEYEEQRPEMLHGRDQSLEYVVEEGLKPGLLVIFNMFTNQRKGTKEDAEGLRRFFEGVLNFTVKEYDNMSKDNVMKKLRFLQEYIGEERFNRFFCVIMSHGNEDGIITCKPPADPPVERAGEVMKIDEILPFFDCENLKVLEGIPKVFLVQCCRGNRLRVTSDNVLDEQEPEAQTETDTLLTTLKTPADADFLIAYSQTHGFQSFRDGTGSWFIQDILNVFRRNYHQHHVADMLIMVNAGVGEKRAIVGEGAILNKYCKQMPCQVSTLRKSIYLC